MATTVAGEAREPVMPQAGGLGGVELEADASRQRTWTLGSLGVLGTGGGEAPCRR